jgi:hypothetical protein
MDEYNEQAVETLDDAGCIIANKNIIIDNLQAKVAELEEEKKELQALLDFDNARLDQIEDELEDVEYLGPYVEGIKVLKTQLAAEQLNNKQLREALTTCVCAMQDYQAGIGITEMFDKGERLGRKALAVPRDTSALDAYVAENVKEATATQKEYYEGVFQDGSKQIAKAFRQRDLAVEALKNCRLLAARHRKEEWAGHIMRFCKDAGLSGSPIRNDAIKESEAK